MPLNIALDGPVGAGKSTIAKQVADCLGILHVDSGAMYRAVGLKCLRQGVDLQDEGAVAQICDCTEIRVFLGAKGQRTLLDGEDVSDQIRTPEVSLAASAVSKVGAVRRRMTELQRGYAQEMNLIMDGRDIGTQVLPSANVKIFLTAAAEERAKRRHLELAEKGADISFEQVLAELNARDAQDSSRALAPLKQAEDAHGVDTTEMTQEEVVACILQIVKKACR